MTLDLLFPNFAEIVRTPADVDALNQTILDLAVRGQLVPQVTGDDLVLLRNQPTQFFNADNSGESVMEQSQEEWPFELPRSWRWAPLFSLGATQTGTTPSKAHPEYYGGPYPFVRPSDIANGTVSFSNETLSDVGIANGRFIKAGSILMVCIGSVGKTGITRADCSCNQQINAITPNELIDGKYLLYALLSPYFQSQAKDRASKTTLPILNKSKWESIGVPLPPLAEQQRIVAKVDELFAHTRALAARLEQAQAQRRIVTAAALHRVDTAADTPALSAAWTTVREAFGDLFDEPPSVAALRQTILNLAVRGRLVAQDAGDEPASVLLERIESEKTQLLRLKNLKSSVSVTLPDETEEPYQLPSCWTWVTLDQICYQITDGTHYTPQYVDEGVPFLSVKDISSGRLNFDNTRYITRQAHDELTKRCRPEIGDLLLTKVGTTGIGVIVDTDREFSIFVSVALLKYPQTSVESGYLMYVVNSPLVKQQSDNYTMGVGNKNLVLKYIRAFHVPLPPLAEQRRIVAKVDELMRLCDALEAKLAGGEAARSQLAGAVLAGVVA